MTPLPAPTPNHAKRCQPQIDTLPHYPTYIQLSIKVSSIPSSILTLSIYSMSNQNTYRGYYAQAYSPYPTANGQQVVQHGQQVPAPQQQWHNTG